MIMEKAKFKFMEFFEKNIEENKISFLARVFGIFSEEIPKIWFELKGFQVLGRPTISIENENKTEKATLDFCQEKGGKYYIVEQKCFLAYDDCKLLNTESDEFKNAFEKWHNNKKEQTKAWKFFVNFNTNTGNYSITYKKNKNDKSKPLKNNEIKKKLIWGSISDNGKEIIKKHLGEDLEIYSIEEMIKEIINKEEYLNLIKSYQDSLIAFFNFLNTGKI